MIPWGSQETVDVPQTQISGPSFPSYMGGTAATEVPTTQIAETAIPTGPVASPVQTDLDLALALEELRRKKIALEGFPTFPDNPPMALANEGGRIAELISPENDRDTVPAMLTENENVVTRRAVLGLDLMHGGIGDFTRGHEILDNINQQGEDYLDEVLNRPLFNGGRYA